MADVTLDVRDGCLGAKTKKKQPPTKEQLEALIQEQVKLIITNLLTKGD